MLLAPQALDHRHNSTGETKQKKTAPNFENIAGYTNNLIEGQDTQTSIARKKMYTNCMG